MSIKHWTIISMLALLSACGGGGSGLSGGPPPASNNSGGSTAPTTVDFSIRIPPASTQTNSRRRMYVSPNTKSVAVQQLDSSNNVVASQTYNVTSTSNGCTTNSSGTTCTFSFPAPAGTFNFSVKSYSATGGGGSLLSESTLTNVTILKGQANQISVTMNGVLASVGFAAGSQSISATLGAPQTVNFIPQDATGATIIGPGTYDNGPLTISNSASSVATVSPSSFSAPGTTSASLQCSTAGNGTLTFGDPTGTLPNGTGNATVTFTCSAAALTLTPGALDFNTVAANSSDATYDQSVTVTDGNPSPQITWNLSCPASNVAVVGTGTKVAIRPLTVGTCSLSASDQYNASSQTITVEVHTTSITINSRRRL
ncbi:MAG TPA: hypothetical protein VFE17_06045 [Candidatus Baltobacteraceae bacterium]|jgi:hypothetical protein|nr:hypothetical protein [Candidatus Baltobacteraceae bacterium]